MKNINKFINEGKKGTNTWHYVDDMSWCLHPLDLPGLGDKKAKWLWINTEAGEIGPCTQSQLNDWEEEEDLVKSIKSLEVGEVYDADGGINLYLRIRK